MKRKKLLLIAISTVVLSITVFTGFASAHPDQKLISAQTLCGDGSEADQYGFNYDLQQPHWTVDYQNFVSEDTVNQVDVILDRLNNDSIAQTMILFKNQDQVGNRVNCAVHFLRYMKLGLSYGERKDNGFVFLIVVENNKIDVHYGVGLGLPALTAPGLTNLNRVAEETYQSTHSMDEALLALVKGFDEYTRSKYSPLASAPAPAQEPTSVYITMPSVPFSSMGTGTICCIACIGIILLVLLVIFISKFGRFISWIPTLPGSGWGNGSSPWSGGSSGGDGPVLRGGGGSGRSNRGN